MTEETTPPDAPDEAPPLPHEIVAQALYQFADFIKEAGESEDNCFDDPNAHNNALIAAMALVGFVPHILASDYIEAQKCLAEMMSALFGALNVPRLQQGATAAGMIDGITIAKAQADGTAILKPTGIEVSRYGRMMGRNGKRHGKNRRRKGK